MLEARDVLQDGGLVPVFHFFHKRVVIFPQKVKKLDIVTARYIARM